MRPYRGSLGRHSSLLLPGICAIFTSDDMPLGECRVNPSSKPWGQDQSHCLDGRDAVSLRGLSVTRMDSMTSLATTPQDAASDPLVIRLHDVGKSYQLKRTRLVPNSRIERMSPPSTAAIARRRHPGANVRWSVAADDRFRRASSFDPLPHEMIRPCRSEAILRSEFPNKTFGVQRTRSVSPGSLARREGSTLAAPPPGVLKACGRRGTRGRASPRLASHRARSR